MKVASLKFSAKGKKEEPAFDDVKIDNSGNIEFVDESGRSHNTRGPAVEWSSGNKEWRVNGKLHREDGPAYERADGYKEYWLNGKFIGSSMTGFTDEDLADVEKHWKMENYMQDPLATARQVQHPETWKLIKQILRELSEKFNFPKTPSVYNTYKRSNSFKVELASRWFETNIARLAAAAKYVEQHYRNLGAYVYFSDKDESSPVYLVVPFID